ncbi:MAG: ribonuclease P protein component, partial [Clostridia bacterium]
MQSKYRLKSKKSFNYIYKKGESTANKYIALLSVPSKFPKKFGFSVSKKVGNSVVRNKVKRRLKEIVRSYIPTID